MTKTLPRHRELFSSILLICLISAIAYLPFVTRLGFYHDEWFALASKVSGVSLVDMFSVDRPMLGRIFALQYRLFGDAPLIWQLAAFSVRLGGSLLFFAMTRLAWPDQKRATTWMAVLFAVYPGYLSLFFATNYEVLLIGLDLGLLSLLLSVLAVRSRALWLKGALTLAAAGLILIYPRIYEGLIGLEGIRLVLIGLLLWRSGPEPHRLARQKLAAGLAYWLPALAATGVYLYWRFVIFQSGRTTVDTGGLVAGYLTDPLASVGRVVGQTLVDFVETTLLAWFVPLAQFLEGSALADVLLMAALGLAAAALLFGQARLAAWTAQEPVDAADPALSSRDASQTEMIWAGVLSALAGLAPVALSERSFGFNGMDRYSMVAMVGAAMLAVGLLERFVRLKFTTAACGLFVFLSVGTHVLNGAYYRDAWEVQRQFWWQLAWRAPQIQAETALVPVLPEGYRLAEDFEAWAPANAVYYGLQAPIPGSVSITAEVLNRDTVHSIRSERQVWRGYRLIGFTKKFNFTLLASMPAADGCMRLIDQNQVELSRQDDPLVALAAPVSRIEQVIPTGDSPTPPAVIFGPEPAHGWCYYYQKASLARQQGDWEEAARLGREAEANGLAPSDPVEWLPFYEAYFLTEDAGAAERAAGALQAQPELLLSFCGQFGATKPAPNAAVESLCKQTPQN